MGCVSYDIFMPGSKMWTGYSLMTVIYGEGNLGEKRMLERKGRSKTKRMTDINKGRRIKSGINSRKI